MSIQIGINSTIPCKITSVRFPGLPTVARKIIPVSNRLPASSGFPFRMDPPSPSFKVFRALCNSGLRDTAFSALAQRKRSYVTVDHVVNASSEFFTKSPPRIQDPFYKKVLDTVRAEFKVWEKVPILDFKSASRQLPQSTSPGFPWIHTHPGLKKGAVIDKYSKTMSSYWDRVRSGSAVHELPDCAAFARSHISSPNVNKVRLVWAFPLTVVISECQYGHFILKSLTKQEIGHHTGYGMEMMRGGMSWLNSKVIDGRKHVMTDFKGFDSTIPAWLIRDAFSIIEEKIDFSKMSNIQGDSWFVDAQRERRVFKKCVNYFINTPVRFSDGTRCRKDKGVPSGSFFTNLIDTIVNMITTRYASYRVFGALPKFDVYFGDDSLFSLPSTAVVDLQKYSEVVLQCFGLNLNLDKSYWTNKRRNIKFLGYYNCDGSPVKSDLDLIACMLFPQFLQDSWAYCISRALGCLLASAGNSSKVFQAAQAICRCAQFTPGAVEEGIRLIGETPRTLRFLATMGVDHKTLNSEYFMDQSLSHPVNCCSKLVKGI